MKEFKIPADDACMLSLHTFDINNPKAVVQIVHGMEEHQERYERFAAFLNERGYTVVTSDLRGHGKDADYPGFFKEKNGCRELISDQIKIRKFIAEKYPSLPVYLFAHSMGTIISRVLLQSHSRYYDKVILSGYPNFQAASYVGLVCSAAIQAAKGPKYKSKFLQYTSVGIFNRQITDSKTDVDWICSNEDTVNAYLKDPFCGIGFTCSAFHDLYRLVIRMHQPRLYKNVKKNLPILLLRGREDPCTGGKRGAGDSRFILCRAGFQNIRQIAYPRMRHEILNERDYHKVFRDIGKFFDR